MGLNGDDCEVLFFGTVILCLIGDCVTCICIPLLVLLDSAHVEPQVQSGTRWISDLEQEASRLPLISLLRQPEDLDMVAQQAARMHGMASSCRFLQHFNAANPKLMVHQVCRCQMHGWQYMAVEACSYVFQTTICFLESMIADRNQHDASSLKLVCGWAEYPI
jgi:hypothetical protein